MGGYNSLGRWCFYRQSFLLRAIKTLKFTPNLTSLWGDREKRGEGYEKGEWKKKVEMREENKREDRRGEQEKDRKVLYKPQQHVSPRDWVCR